MNKRIDLTWFERFPQHDEEDCAIITDDTYALNWEVPKLIAELKRCYDLIDAANRCIDQASKELQNCADCGGHREEEGLLHECQNYCRCDEFFDESASE